MLCTHMSQEFSKYLDNKYSCIYIYVRSIVMFQAIVERKYRYILVIDNKFIYDTSAKATSAKSSQLGCWCHSLFFIAVKIEEKYFFSNKKYQLVKLIS